MNLKLLAEPFAANEIEWRVGQAGMNKQNAVWAKVLAYVTNRAIMDRLDAACGPENWRNEFRYEAGGAILCGISIRVGTEWVTKWDGAEATDIEAVKGGLSNAMKRAGVQWGIGRYLYDLEEGWAEISENGTNYVPKNDKKGTPAFRWSPPKLPAWALPSVVAEPKPIPSAPAFVASTTGDPADASVRGRRLGDFEQDELRAMQKALRADGKDKHKLVLASIIAVLNDRLLGKKPEPKPEMTDDQRGASILAASNAVGKGDGLNFD